MANQTSATVSVYTINADDGTLSINLGVITGTSPRSVTVDPAGRFAYVANFTSNSISAYTVNAGTGALSPVTGSPFAADSGPISVTVDPSGKFAYAANSSSNSVSAYTINAGSGALSQIDADQVMPGVQHFPAGTTPASVTVDPTGRFAYVTNSGSTSVSVYTINPSTGALTSIGAVLTQTTPSSVTVDPTGRFAYVANSGSNTASDVRHQCRAPGSLPMLAPCSRRSFRLPSRSIRRANLLTWRTGIPTPSRAYTINSGTGVLTAFAGGSFATASRPLSVTVDPSGKFAYTANFSSNTVSVYSINAGTGALAIVDLNVTAVTGPVSIVTTGRIQ